MCKHEWLFDVLEDLKTYAHRNGLFETADRIDCAADSARLELEYFRPYSTDTKVVPLFAER